MARIIETNAPAGVPLPFLSFLPSSLPSPDLIRGLTRQSMRQRGWFGFPIGFHRCTSAWTTGSSPVVTRRMKWLGKTRAQTRRENEFLHPPLQGEVMNQNVG
jgi:hypothetical protein